MSDALAKAPDNVVRAILIALCSDSDINRKANAYLKKIASKTDSQVPTKSNTSGTNTRKRKATEEVHICVQCQQPFYKDENNAQACKFHNGDLEVDDEDDFWADHDENCHGEIDTEGMREEFPDGFAWDCCGKKGNTTGCVQGPHMATGASRGRYVDESGSE
ncbi:hypothetical protein F4820DRAFT_445621 [Hypoxylon rubiginosum]|uniref:Uncharacterized protein n=1 Tax=Hypoxylon rubiginosum TaxID=110542 RepID=A0ACB9Z8I0_9PEZI|nr:hypothetical protein F4820DRAFT_445621 [Hypoxylon rubiginosum]